MKRIFSIFAAALIIFSAASCKKEDKKSDPQEPKFTLTLNLDDVSWNRVKFSITPSDNEVEYSYCIFLEADVEKYANAKACVEDLLSQIVANGGGSYEDYKNAKYVYTGPLTKKYSETNLTAEKRYFFIAFQIDHNLNVVGDVVEKKFETLREGFVDLGLPSGKVWRNSNEPNGNQGLSYYYWTYTDAYNYFGSMLPTKENWEELANREICTWNYDMDQRGINVVGPNGNSIFLPLDGGCNTYNTSIIDQGYNGWYWTSKNNNATTAWDVEFGFSGQIEFRETNKTNALSVRLVDYNPNKK